MRAYTSPASPTVSSALPATSSRAPACSSRDSGTCARAIQNAAAAIGRLITKTQRHDTESMRYPPRKGPMAVAMPPSPDHAPMARPRSFGGERRRHDREAVGHDQRRRHALHAPRRDQRAGVGRDRAQQRRERERNQPDLEDPATAVAVTERTTEHEERTEREQVPGEHPLQIAEVRVQVAGDRGQCRVHDRAVEEGDPRAEHRGGDDPATFRGAHVQPGGTHTSSEARAWQNQTMPRTLSEKVWERHVVRHGEGEPDLLYIDLHLIHEVTSPQAFDGLRLAGRTVRRPDLTVATMDHNVPTRAHRPAGRRPDLARSRWRCSRRIAPSSASGSTRWARPARASCTSSARSSGSRSRA